MQHTVIRIKNTPVTFNFAHCFIAMYSAII